MIWDRLGRVFDPTAQAEWMKTHAALPVVTEICDGRATVVCSGRDDNGRGRTGAVAFDFPSCENVEVLPDPLLPLGDLGTFDDRGVLSSCVVVAGGRHILYYTGVMLGQTVPFYFNVGAAVRTGDKWEKISRAPILSLSDVDPLLTASPCVLYDAGKYRMWYVSCVRWILEQNVPKHYYHIRYAESNDGLSWTRDGTVSIDFRGNEYALARPSVLRDDDCYRMWYPYRGNVYRIGYAESTDGVSWSRKDAEMAFGGDVAEWESQMQCYPYVFDYDGARYMLYNGNDYGRTGFGLARLRGR